MRTLNNLEYRQLITRIMQRYGKRLNLLKVDACELADSVLFGDCTEEKIMSDLENLLKYPHPQPIT